MLGTIVTELFPNECVVLEIKPHTQYVYPIFKNGSTSLINSGYKTISSEELKTLDNVDIYVRDPHARFISGVQTYLGKLDKNIDKKSAIYFIENYLYLNRHFCPQLFWLINFRRFSNASFTIKPLDQLSDITNLTENKSTIDIDLYNYFSQNIKIRFYNEIDEVLTVNLLGKTVEFSEIMSVLKENYNELYYTVFNTAKELIHVVR